MSTLDWRTMSASQINYREMRKLDAYERLADNPKERARAIAHHYLSCAAYAAQLMKLVDTFEHMPRDEREDHPDIAKAADYIAQQILMLHETDLGISLAWPSVRTAQPSIKNPAHEP
jgi:hypothetical protein